MSASHLRTEMALDTFLQHFQSGSASPKSRAAIEAVYEESMEIAWPQLLEALEDFGLDQNTANENHLFIVDWLVGAMMDGLLPVGGIEPTNSSSASSAASFSGSDARISVDSYTSGEAEPDEYPGVLDHHLSPKPTSPVEGSEELCYMKAFGQLGRIVMKEVRSGPGTFKEDINRAREYWKRRDWEAVKSHLLRILVTTQRPNHRQSDLSPRTAAFLLGIAFSNSGDLDTAMQVMLSVMTPFDENDLHNGPCDEGHIAAATWLGDLCLKTNRIESAALAWAMAFDAANLRSTRMSQGYTGDRDTPTGEHSRGSSWQSSPMTPAPLHPVPKRTSSLSKAFRLARAQAIAILNRLESVNRKIRNLEALSESLASGWDPDNADHIFAQSRILSNEQMQRVAQKAMEAIETAVESNSTGTARPSPRASEDLGRQGSKPLPSPPPRREVLAAAGGRMATEEMLTPAEDVLQSPVRSSDWPLAYDTKFSRSAAITTINWVHSFTPLDLEDVMSKITTVDVRQYRALNPGSGMAVDFRLDRTTHPTIGKPVFIAGKLDPKKMEDSGRFLATLQQMLSALGFEYLEEPGQFRCRPKTDRSSKWPSIACFALRVIKYKLDGFKRGSRFAMYINNVLHWNGQTEDTIIDHAETKLLTAEMVSTLQSLEAADRDLWAAKPRAPLSRPPALWSSASRSTTSRSPAAAETQLKVPSSHQRINLTGPRAVTISRPLNPKVLEAPW